MAAKDTIHNAVKNALIKDGWVITNDPYKIQFIIQRYQVKILVVDVGKEEVTQWIN
jgi:hypothetical protein